MVHPFLITGLPRSRTAWLAAVASTMAGAICLHEITAELKCWEGIFDIWRSSQEFQYVGISDSALGFRLKEIIDRAAPRILMVERDINEVNASLTRMGARRSNYCDLLAERLCEFEAHPLVKIVQYRELDDPRKVAECLRFLMPDAVISEQKIAALQPLNVQADFGRAMRMAPGRAAMAAELFGPEIMARLSPILQ